MDGAKMTWRRGKTGGGPWRQPDVDRLAGSVGRHTSPCRRTKVRFCGPTPEPAAGSQQFQLPCPCNGFRAPLHIQLVEDVLVVPLHGAQRQKDLLADFLVGQALADQGQDL